MKNRKHILIVDDVTTNLRFLGEVLKDGYSLSMAKSGKQALKILEKTFPNLILLDVKMPEMDGYETFSRIRENSKTADIPIIFLSADTQKENEEKGLSLGASAFIHKPFDPASLVEIVDRILQKQDAENEIQIIANSDAITGLWNRKYLEKVIKETDSANDKALFLLLNFNMLKISDVFSKKFTEETLLIKISKALCSSVRPDDLISRIGGFEFSIYMKNLSVEDYDSFLLEFVENVKRNIADEFGIKEAPSFDIGLAKYPENGTSFSELYNFSDKKIERKASVVEVSKLESLIEDDDSLSGPMVVDYADFKDIYRFMKRYAQRTGERLQLVLFTLKDLSGSISTKDMLRCMNILETSIRSTFRKNDAATKYSENQYLVILSDLNNQNRSEVIQRVTDNFETTIGNGDILLKVDIDNTDLEA